MDYPRKSVRFRVPGEMALGYTLFGIPDGGESGYMLTLFRLKEGTDLAAFQEALVKVDEVFGTGEGVNEAINPALEMAEIYGELSADPNSATQVGIVLDEGTYLLDGSYNTEEGMPERSYHTFTVSGEAQAEAPEVDQTV
jgi:hypothetical protein